jgi:hypothetical protein
MARQLHHRRTNFPIVWVHVRNKIILTKSGTFITPARVLLFPDYNRNKKYNLFNDLGNALVRKKQIGLESVTCNMSLPVSSVVVTIWQVGCLESRKYVHLRRGHFCFHHSFRTMSGPSHPPAQLLPAIPSPEIKLLRRAADHLPAHSVEVYKRLEPLPYPLFLALYIINWAQGPLTLLETVYV